MFFGKRENANSVSSKTRSHVKGRHLLFEPLEERQLLAVSPVPSDVWSEVTAKYSDLNWTAIGDYNYIEITADQLSDAALRDAIAQAGTTPENDLIVVRTTAMQNTITLAGTELGTSIGAEEFGNVTIVSLGETQLTIDADQKSRVFNLGANTNTALAGLVITNGRVSGANYGGGIYSSGTLTVSNSTISDNSASSSSSTSYGGGIYSSGTLTVSNSTISDNSATSTSYYYVSSGGGIYNDGILTITNSAIVENSATSTSSFSGSFSSFSGGGIYNSGTLTVMNSTISGNSVVNSTSYYSSGGGIYNGGTLTVMNSTISGNSVVTSTSYYFSGGGIYNDGTLTVMNSTISGNSAYSDGGGIYSYYGTLTVNNSIVVENSSDLYRSGGTIQGHNNLTTYTNWNGSSGENFLYDSELPLFVDAENGDYRLAEGSQAIDKGSNRYALEAGLDENSRDLANNPRFSCLAIDIGAYEHFHSTDYHDYETPSLVVTTLDDVVDYQDGKISLREAIVYVGVNGLGTTITFDPSLAGSTIVLDGYELLIDKNVTIDATGMNITIDANKTSRVFNITSTAEVSFIGLTITGGYLRNGHGGGINNSGTLTIADCTISENRLWYSESAVYGGGIYNSGTLTVINSKISGNQTTGGLSAVSGGGSSGAGIYNSGTMTVMNSLISGNSALGVDGAYGGGIYNSGTSDMVNCTIVGNMVSDSLFARAYGGAIYNDKATITITNCTITENKATSTCGGICSANAQGTVSIYNTIIVENSNSDISGTVQGSNNLTTFAGWGDDDLDNFIYDPELPLFVDAANGDYHLVPASQAIDRGNNSFLPESITTDLSGRQRIIGGIVDIGAYEYSGWIISQTGVFQGTVAFSWTQYENAESLRLTWVSGTTATVLGTFTAEGSFLWDTTQYADTPGILKFEYLDEKNRVIAYGEYVGTIINDPGIVIHRGGVTANETWSKDKMHLVIGQLNVKNGAMLTIAEDTVVKFWKNAFINVGSGNWLEVKAGTVLTRAEDDEVAGDTNKDGNLSTPKNGNAYFRGMGNIQVDPTAELKYLIQTHSGTITGTETWVGGQVYHITGNLTVASGAILTILPGAILKFDNNCSLIVNSGGTLNASGTSAQPIIFTSIKDDAYGGDTNEDEDQTHPASGDWHQIYANGGTIRMNHTLVSYCSNVNNQGGLYVSSNGSFEFNNSIITTTRFDCVRNNGGTFTSHNSIFQDSSMGIAPVSGTTTLINCTIANVTTAVRWESGLFINCVFANITSVFEEWGPASFQNCVFWNPKGLGPQSCSVVGSNDNFWADPMFYDVANGDYRLRPGSPLIDAADGTKAPTTDITGAPRVNDPHITSKKGIPNSNGIYADIGAYEFTDGSSSSVDLEPVNLQAPQSAATGEKITLQWTIHNNGSAPATGTWTDRIVMISGTGQVVTVGEITHSGNIAGGDLQTFYAEITVPNASVGDWRFEVHVNVNRNIFEGTNIDNNTISAVQLTRVDVPLLTEKNLNLAVTKSTPQLYRVVVPAGQAFSLTAFSETAISILMSENHAPTATSSDYAAATDGKGNYTLSVPAASTARTFYLQIATDKPAANVSVNISDKTLDIISVTQSQVSNAGTSTIGFIGTGFDETMTVALKLGSTTINGTALSVNSGSEASARFDLTDKAAGVYDLVVTKNSQTVTLQNAVNVTANGVGAKLEAYFDIVDAVRVGRIYEGYIIFTNTGDCDLLLPVFTITSTTNMPIGLTSDSIAAGNTIHLLAVGSPGSAGVLRPGETGRVTFYFRATNNTRVSFSTWVDDNTTTPFLTSDFWTNWADLHVDLSDAMTRLEQRGYLPEDYGELKSFVTAQKSGNDTTGLSGHLRNTQTGEAIADATILAEWIDGNESKYDYAKTDTNGHYVFNYLPANATVTLSLLDTAYDLSTTTVQMKNGKDMNGFNMTALSFGTISGRVIDENGLPVAGASVFVLGEDEENDSSGHALTDTNGCFIITGLKADAYTVYTYTNGQYKNQYKEVGTHTVTLTNGANIIGMSFKIETGAIVTGRITNEIGQPIAGASVSICDAEDHFVSAITDENGFYTASGLSPGDVKITISAQGYATRQQIVQTIPENGTLTFDYTSEIAATLSGTVKNSDGVAVSGYFVLLEDINTNHVFLSFTNEDGSYLIDNLASGTYKVFIFSLDESYQYSNITVAQGQNLTDQNLTYDGDTSVAPDHQYAMVQGMEAQQSLMEPVNELVKRIEGIIRDYLYKNIFLPEEYKTLYEVYLAVWLFNIQESMLKPTLREWAIKLAFNEYTNPDIPLWFLDHYMNEVGDVYISNINSSHRIIELIQGSSPYQDIKRLTESGIKNHYNQISKPAPIGDEYLLYTKKLNFSLNNNPELYWTFGGFSGPASAVFKLEDVIDKDDHYEYSGTITYYQSDVYDFNWDRWKTVPFRLLEKFGWAKIFTTYITIEEEYTFLVTKLKNDPPKDDPKDDDDPDDPQSCDPNEINGPTGFDFEAYNAGTEDEPYLVITSPNWTSSEDAKIYTIYFENKGTASAAAQEIWVTTQLPEDFNWDTFTLGEICIGNQIFNEMVGHSDGTWFLKQSSTGEQIQLTATFDTLTGTANWYLRSYVATVADHFPVSAYAGFLSPNDETGCGEGYIKFSVRLVDDITTETIVENFAVIIFDTNEEIKTNVWKNTIDADRPISNVLVLPEKTNKNRFLVEWEGSDIGSGLAYYDVYVSESYGDFVGEFVLWKNHTTETSAYFDGENGKTYSFYSIATDNVGLIEAKAKVAEAVITVQVSPVVDGYHIVTTLDDVLNPVDGTISLRMALSQAKSGDVITFDSSLFTDGEQTITLSTKLRPLVISSSVTIVGPGSDLLSISSNNQMRVLYIATSFEEVSISGLTIRDGYAHLAGYGGVGAGIYATNTKLTLEDVAFINNSATYGGAICTYYVNLNIVDSKFESNSAETQGGAIWYYGTSSKTMGSEFSITGTEFVNNTAQISGGAIYLKSTANAATIDSSTFENNSAVYGGALYQVSGSVEIIDTLFTANEGLTAEGRGGAIYSAGGKLDISSSSFDANTSTHAAGIWRNGRDVVTLTDVTFDNNAATRIAGAIYCSLHSKDTIVITDSKFESNTAGTHGGAIYASNGTFEVNNSEFTGNNAPQAKLAVRLAEAKFTIDGKVFEEALEDYFDDPIEWL